MVMRSKFELTTIEEKQFYEDVKKILLEAREHAYSNASAIMTQVYWNIGKRIIEQSNKNKIGKVVQTVYVYGDCTHPHIDLCRNVIKIT